MNDVLSVLTPWWYEINIGKKCRLVYTNKVVNFMEPTVKKKQTNKWINISKNTSKGLGVKMNDGVLSENFHFNLEKLIEY